MSALETGPIKDLAALGVWSRGLLLAYAVIAGLAAALALSYGPGFDDENGSPVYLLVALVQALLFLVTGIVVLRWIYCSNINAHRFGAQGMTVGPKMAIAGYFIPIACLFLPFQAMRETWKASENPRDWEIVKAPAIIGWWWFFWVIDGIAGLVGWRLDDAEKYPEAGRAAEQLTTASDILSIGTSILLITIIGRLTAIQRARRESMAAAA